MRKTLLFTLILFALSAWVVAQQAPSSQAPPSSGQGTSQPSTSQAPDTQASPSAGQSSPSAGQTSPSAGQGDSQASAGQSVQGCLGGSGNSFTVTDKTGTSYQLQLPAGADASNLKPHIGEEVRVEGSTSGGSGANSAASTSGSGPSITVKNIYRVSPTCSNKSGATPKQ